jgi:Domain of unknown function (DUF4232)
MPKLSRRALAAAAAVLAAGTWSVTWAATSAVAAPAKPAPPRVVAPRCNPDQLYVWVSPDSANGTAGTTYFKLDYTNIGRATCHLYGWPGVSATDLNGKQLGVPALRDPDVTARYINVVPGGTAHSSLGYVDAQVYSGCPRATATYLKVYPPDGTGARNAYFPLKVCTNRTYDLTIGRVQAGA